MSTYGNTTLAQGLIAFFAYGTLLIILHFLFSIRGERLIYPTHGAPLEREGHDTAVDDLLLLGVVDYLLRQEALPESRAEQWRNKDSQSEEKNP